AKDDDRSSVLGDGLDRRDGRLEAAVSAVEAVAEDRRPVVVLRPGRPSFTIRREGEAFRVIGRGVERWVMDTDLEDPESVRILQRRLVREGVERELAAAGARRGDEVRIAEEAFEFLPEGSEGSP
ncbi:MAG: Obg family GTPase CgtA, partial [Actinomycetota bacterium]